MLSQFGQVQWAASSTCPLDGYLAQWIDVEPLERLRAAWRLAEPLCCLHSAISYQQIRANVEVEARQEFAGEIEGCVRRILVALLPPHGSSSI